MESAITEYSIYAAINEAMSMGYELLKEEQKRSIEEFMMSSPLVLENLPASRACHRYIFC